jgi:antirestriction protein ArdC
MRAEDLLPDDQNQGLFNGTAVRKGTVGAFLMNARTLIDPQTPEHQRTAATQDILQALPALRALGLFELMQVRDPLLRALCEQEQTSRPPECRDQTPVAPCTTPFGSGDSGQYRHG